MTKNSKKTFEIRKVTDRIYVFLFENAYDLCMHFLRYQEYYESPKFKGKEFTIIEFMEWYAKTMGNGLFTYPSDWRGFNIPSHVIWEAQASGKIEDYNLYDKAMWSAYNMVGSTIKHNSFYILGVCKSELNVLDHELAHALYYVNEEYANDMNGFVNKLTNKVLSSVYRYFEQVGYSKEVYKDELQAYFSTGLPRELAHHTKLMTPFTSAFKSYIKSIPSNLEKMKLIA